MKGLGIPPSWTATPIKDGSEGWGSHLARRLRSKTVMKAGDLDPLDGYLIKGGIEGWGIPHSAWLLLIKTVMKAGDSPILWTATPIKDGNEGWGDLLDLAWRLLSKDGNEGWGSPTSGTAHS